MTANATGTGATTFTASGGGYTSAVITATEVASTTGTPSLLVTPASQNITQGGTGTVGVSLSSAPSANVTVSVARTSGNTGLSVTAGSSLTFTPANFAVGAERDDHRGQLKQRGGDVHRERDRPYLGDVHRHRGRRLHQQLHGARGGPVHRGQAVPEPGLRR